MALDKLTNQQGLIPMLGKLTKEFRVLLMQEFQKQGINLSKEQFIILKILSQKQNCTQQDLTIVTARDKTTLTRLLTTMEKKAYITKKQSTTDKRVNIVEPTQKGLAELNKSEPIVLQLLDQAMHGIEESRINQAKSLFKDIYSNLNISYEK